jgi:hypothetical protein
VRRLTIALAATVALPLGAQPPLRPGARVRVGMTVDSLAATPAASGGWWVGTVVSTSTRDLVLRPTPLADSVVLSMAEIRRIDLSRGRPSRRWSGAVIGGLLSGGAFAAAACAFSDGSCSVSDNVGGFLGYYAVGAVPGVLVGGALGSRLRGRERWEQVYGAR